MFLKDADSVLDYAVDWTVACAGEKTIAESSWRVVPAGLEVAGESAEPLVALVRLGRGVAGVVHHVTNHVRFSDGTVDERSIIVRVEER